MSYPFAYFQWASMFIPRTNIKSIFNLYRGKIIPISTLYMLMITQMITQYKKYMST